MVIERDQVKQKESSLRRQLLETGVVFSREKKWRKKDVLYFYLRIFINDILHHPHVLWTDKRNHCGVDFSKAVVITDEKYIDKTCEPHLRQNEFDALRGKDFKIMQKMLKYINKYKQAKMEPEKSVNRVLLKYSTL